MTAVSRRKQIYEETVAEINQLIDMAKADPLVALRAYREMSRDHEEAALVILLAALAQDEYRVM